VVPKENQTLSPGEILDFLHGYVARFKQPKDIQVVEEIPHHVTGKVLRRVLRGEELLRSSEGEEEQE
jgi:long-chain acyl-CoA synthetase